MGIDRKTFIAKAEQIASEEPTYRYGGWGNDGTCDCIGLIIGAIRRADGNWRGTHGSNYAARSEMDDLLAVAAIDDLDIGDAVYKAREPDDRRYALPDKYRPGGGSYNGDVRDYYHVGIVESISPLKIRHMTTPRPKMDDALGKWAYHGHLKKIDYKGGGTMGEKATVVLPSGVKGSTVNLRNVPSTSGDIIARIPVGTVVDVIEDMGRWCNVAVQGYNGYMMSNYLEYQGGGEEVSGDILTAEERDKIDHALIDIETRLEIIRDILGRG